MKAAPVITITRRNTSEHLTYRQTDRPDVPNGRWFKIDGFFDEQYVTLRYSGNAKRRARDRERASARENVGAFPEAGVVKKEEEQQEKKKVFEEALETSTIASTEPVGGATSL